MNNLALNLINSKIQLNCPKKLKSLNRKGSLLKKLTDQYFTNMTSLYLLAEISNKITHADGGKHKREFSYMNLDIYPYLICAHQTATTAPYKVKF